MSDLTMGSQVPSWESDYTSFFEFLTDIFDGGGVHPFGPGS